MKGEINVVLQFMLSHVLGVIDGGFHGRVVIGIDWASSRGQCACAREVFFGY